MALCGRAMLWLTWLQHQNGPARKVQSSGAPSSPSPFLVLQIFNPTQEAGNVVCAVSRKDKCRNSDVRERCGLKEDVVARAGGDLAPAPKSDYDPSCTHDSHLKPIRPKSRVQFQFKAGSQSREYVLLGNMTCGLLQKR
ncbi:hypothetical protein EVAR_79213_1 [Eumeta japonica]|uniref:Uncharacterized protein n=1 Tax=Eumeta variegata TaxID=151549 RepID=A0A4C1UV44_EUMVA|nr:hypothetical protein EVAR_79213_1 [Eumeta japonica]